MFVGSKCPGTKQPNTPAAGFLSDLSEMEGLVADQTIYGRRLVEIYPELLQS